MKYFRSVLECHLHVINTNNNDLYAFLLERCGDCYFMIARYFDKANQYNNELKTNEIYDLEIREALRNEYVHCTQGM